MRLAWSLHHLRYLALFVAFYSSCSLLLQTSSCMYFLHFCTSSAATAGCWWPCGSTVLATPFAKLIESITASYISMCMTSGATAMWVAIALVFVTAVITKAMRTRIKHDSVCTRPPPPVVKGGSIIGLLHTFFTKGFRAMIQDQYAKLGSVFTISFFGLKCTFLIGPEVSGHFYQGLDSELSHGRILEFTVPMFGKEVGYGVDAATRSEQRRFEIDALKPSKLKSHVGPMLQEVEVSNKSPTHLNTVPLGI
ncbi:hypothetical protein BAE44_0005284 [Dichanthelium oligosanthes]|uniref:Uncharacterized protein n=1 Tax=Dichanthelium oligosanthes TaxID=888268 RepID=A0A1E5W8J8_9POAL|nr:hypothetical protein BAE44_0005284 [Dichanthelium oligosanthes]